MNKQNISLIVFVLGLFCQSLSNAESNREIHFNQVGEIVYIDVEGGFWGIETAQGRYIAQNLPAMLQKKALKVRFDYILPKKKFVGIHMWGQYINLYRIEVVACAETN